MATDISYFTHCPFNLCQTKRLTDWIAKEKSRWNIFCLLVSFRWEDMYIKTNIFMYCVGSCIVSILELFCCCITNCPMGTIQLFLMCLNGFHSSPSGLYTKIPRSSHNTGTHLFHTYAACETCWGNTFLLGSHPHAARSLFHFTDLILYVTEFI